MCNETENNFVFTPEQVVEELNGIGVYGINPDFVTVIGAREEINEDGEASQMILAEVDQPFETLEDLKRWGEVANKADRESENLKHFFHNEWSGLQNKHDPSDIRVRGKVAFILGADRDEIARELFFQTHNPVEMMIREALSGAGLGGRDDAQSELDALLQLLGE